MTGAQPGLRRHTGTVTTYMACGGPRLSSQSTTPSMVSTASALLLTTPNASPQFPPPMPLRCAQLPPSSFIHFFIYLFISSFSYSSSLTRSSCHMRQGAAADKLQSKAAKGSPYWTCQIQGRPNKSWPPRSLSLLRHNHQLRPCGQCLGASCPLTHAILIVSESDPLQWSAS